MADITKRMNYYNHQFLREADLNLQQDYHMDRHRRHNRLQHTWGVADGLEVEFVGGATSVTVRAGTAIDGEGREIVLAADDGVELSGVAADQDVYITITYTEELSDPTAETGAEGDTRWSEVPLIEVSDNLPINPELTLVLAQVTRTGTTVTAVDNTIRTLAGVVGGDLEVTSLTLTDPGVIPAQWPSMSLDSAERAKVTGSLRITESLTVDGTITGNIAPGSVEAVDIVNDAVTSAKLREADGTSGQNTNTGSGVKTNHIQNDAVTADKIAANAVGSSELANGAVTNTKVVAGSIKHSNLELDGGRNPHATTAVDVNALSTSGGRVNGRTTIFPYADTSWSHVNIGHSTGTEEISLGVWADKNHRDGIFIFHYGGSTKYALRIPSGKAYFGGGKEGFVSDRFVNASGHTLHTGDIVRLKRSGTVGFHGDMNSIPICEVTLADQENDPCIIGIVDTEALPLHESPDLRSNPDDTLSIPAGGELMVVTLGLYSRCKVDATVAPIKAGDLLTSSNNPGHAQKATNPKIGCIIGKAVESIKDGVGYISVFANIQ